MRKILISVLIILALVVLWLWRGRDFVTFADRFKTVEASVQPITEISYEGSGTGGRLHVADADLSLDETRLDAAKPNVGTTKDGQLALSFGGKVFPFGTVRPSSESSPSEDERLVADVPSGDTVKLSIEHSAMAWPNFFEVNYMTGNSPKWKRYIYRKLSWTKANGAKLEMLWRYEQFFYANDGWVAAFMTRPEATGLIRVEILNASR